MLGIYICCRETLYTVREYAAAFNKHFSKTNLIPKHLKRQEKHYKRKPKYEFNNTTTPLFSAAFKMHKIQWALESLKNIILDLMVSSPNALKILHRLQKVHCLPTLIKCKIPMYLQCGKKLSLLQS